MSLFGVYDGHGGAEVAEWISKRFPGILKKEIEDEKIDLNEAFGKRIQEIFVKTGNTLVLLGHSGVTGLGFRKQLFRSKN